MRARKAEIHNWWEDDILDQDDNIYSKEMRELMEEDDLMSPAEMAFMQGWDEAG